MPAMLVLAAGCPSVEFPAIHPIITRRSRVRGAFIEACRRVNLVISRTWY